MIKGRRVVCDGRVRCGVVCDGRVRCGVVWEIFSDRESPSEQASVGAWWMDGLRELIN